MLGLCVAVGWAQVIVGPIEDQTFLRVPEVAVTTRSGELTVGWRTWSVTAAGGASGGGRALAIGVYAEADGRLVSRLERWEFALSVAESPRRLTLTGLPPGSYRIGTYPRGGTAWLGALNLAGALTTAAVEVAGWDSGAMASPPTLEIFLERVTKSIGDPWVHGEANHNVTTPGEYRVRWVSTNATGVEMTENGIAIDTRLTGDQTFRGGTAKTTGVYLYEGTARGPGGVARATATIQVDDPYLDLRGTPLAPEGSLTASVEDLTLGGSAQLLPTLVDAAKVSALRWTGPDLDAPASNEPLTVTPNRAGKQTYQLQLQGYMLLTWLAPFYATRLELTTPTGTVDVTEKGHYRASQAGDYHLTVYDERGTAFSFAPVSIAAPPMVTYSATLRVKPRIDDFKAVAPPAPTADLLPTSESRVEVGDTMTWRTRFTGERATLVSDDVTVPVTTDSTNLVAAAAGRRVFTLTAFPRSTGRLMWSVAGSIAVEINGIRRVGDHWDEAPPGRYRLRAIGPDDLSADSSEVEVVLPASASAQVERPVYPKIDHLSVEQPTPPRVHWTVGPAERWVNPARVTLQWSTEDAASAVVSAQGPGLAWSEAGIAGERELVLGPGVHQLELEAKPKPARLSWQARGGLSAAWVAPDGTRTSVAAADGAVETLTPGAHRLQITGPDDLWTEAVAETVLIPEPARESLSRTVDVTLALTAGRGGDVRGAGIKAFGSKAFASAEPRRGYHWVEWQGGLSSALTPLEVTMASDVSLTALFAPNRYLVTASVTPMDSGTVNGQGSYDFDSVAVLDATPAPFFRFLRWSTGEFDRGLRVPVDGDSSHVAVFERLQQELTIAFAGAGHGSVNHPGGLVSAGVPIDLVATPDAVSRFLGWAGDVTTAGRRIRVGMERDYHLSANFEPKLEQTVTFPPPPDDEPGRAVSLVATSSSGLPVRFAWVSGPGTLAGGAIRVTGLGVIRVRAWAEGDETYLPSAPVEAVFSGVAPPSVTLREASAEVQLHDTEHAVPNRVLGGP